MLERENELLRASKTDQLSQKVIFLEQELHERTLMSQNLTSQVDKLASTVKAL